ncbi:hypothetical protein INR49_032425 [Caranx melampygus]|nr:hypothetical protein INR49_032425 [Caranx melampygus]
MGKGQRLAEELQAGQSTAGEAPSKLANSRMWQNPCATTVWLTGEHHIYYCPYGRWGSEDRSIP